MTQKKTNRGRKSSKPTTAAEAEKWIAEKRKKGDASAIPAPIRELRYPAYKKAAESSIPLWNTYAGNKSQLVPIIAEALPSKVDRFVDLFGGTGITGVEMNARGKCEEVVYNDLEYDMVLLLEWMYVTPIDEIVRVYEQALDRWFCGIDKLQMFEEDTKEYRERTRDKSGGAHYQMWHAMQDYYNNNRIMLWDRKEDADIRKILTTIEDPEIRRQLSEFLTGKEARKIVDGHDPVSMIYREIKHLRSLNEDVNKKWFDSIPVAFDAEITETQARAHKADESVDIFAARGDYFLPGELLVIMLHSFRGVQKWQDLGRHIGNTPELTKEGKPFKTPDRFLPFVKALKAADVSFYSNSFTEGWIEKEHTRKRSRVGVRRWRHMLASLTPFDVVFIDPPYHGSAASYNHVYTQQSDVYLFAFCQLLTERGIPWIMTNNVHWENELFCEWIQDYYTYTLKPDTLILYAGKKEANEQEIIVTNFKLPMTRKILKEMLVEWNGRGKIRNNKGELVKRKPVSWIEWKTNGGRNNNRSDKDRE